MIVCPDHKLLYLCPPKTGTTTIQCVLYEKFGGFLYQDSFGEKHYAEWVPKYADYYIFISVRHPYQRALSLWRFVQNWRAGPWARFWPGRSPGFLEFLNSPIDQFRTTWRAHWQLEQMERAVDKVIYQEQLDEDLAQIPHFKGVTFPRLNDGPEKELPWFEYFTPEIVERVQALWPEDFTAFGYNLDFDEVVAGRVGRFD